MSALQIAHEQAVLVALAELRPRYQGLEPAPGFPATWQGRHYLVQAVLERTAVVYEQAGGERQLANQRDLLVDPDDLRWQEPAIHRGGRWHRPDRQHLIEPAATVDLELQVPAGDKPAARPPALLEKRRRPRRRQRAIAAERLDQLPPDLRVLVEEARRALIRDPRLAEDLERIRLHIRRCLDVHVGQRTAGREPAGERRAI